MKSINHWVLSVLLFTAFGFSSIANAALVERLGGLAYYDTDLDITWLADANAAGTTMTWDEASTWVAGLDINGVTGWRLPDTLQPDTTCQFQNVIGDSIQSTGLNCTGSEMGHLFYNVLGGDADTSIATIHNANYDLFSNLQTAWYWSGTEYAPNTDNAAWGFIFAFGLQGAPQKGNNYYALAVYSGDVSAIPVPAAVWLFGSGLIGLIGLARHKR